MPNDFYQYALMRDGKQVTDWRECAETTYLAFVRDPQPDVAVRRVFVLDDAPFATNAELLALLPGTIYMAEPDGGAPSVLEQLQRMAQDAARWRGARVGVVNCSCSALSFESWGQHDQRCDVYKRRARNVDTVQPSRWIGVRNG